MQTSVRGSAAGEIQDGNEIIRKTHTDTPAKLSRLQVPLAAVQHYQVVLVAIVRLKGVKRLPVDCVAGQLQQLTNILHRRRLGGREENTGCAG